MGVVRLPQWRPSIKPPGPATAAMVRANCARLGLPAPDIAWIPMFSGDTNTRNVMGTLPLTKIGTAFGADAGPYGVATNWTTDTTATGFESSYPKTSGATWWAGVVAVKRSATAGDYNELVAATGSKYLLRIENNGALAMVKPGSAVLFNSAAGLIGTSQSCVVGGVWKNASTGYLSINGRTVGSGACGTHVVSWDNAWIGTTSGGAFQGRKSIYVALYWEKDLLTESQLNAATNSVFSIIAPPPRRIYIDLAAGGGTTPLVGTAAASAGASGLAWLALALGGSTAAQGAGAAALSLGLGLNGTAAAQASGSGVLSLATLLTGTSAAQSASSAQLVLRLGLSGTSSAVAEALGTLALLLPGQIALVGTAGAAAGAAGSLQLSLSITGTAAALAAAVAALRVLGLGGTVAVWSARMESLDHGVTMDWYDPAPSGTGATDESTGDLPN